MVKTLPYYNSSAYGQGIEGATNYANILVDNWMVPAFLLIMYGIILYIYKEKSEYNFGGVIAVVSASFFIVTMIAMTFVTLSPFILFIFVIGFLFGVVLSKVETAGR